MFDNLSNRLSKSFAGLRGRQLTEANIKSAIAEVRKSLLDADVSLDVIMQFIGDVQRKALGRTNRLAAKPGDVFIKIVHESLVELLGSESAPLSLNNPRDPAVVLVAGLQGAGKTTTVAKLAKYLDTREKKRVGVVSVDVYRPAAIEQLQTLVAAAEIDFLVTDLKKKPVKVLKEAISASRKQGHQVLLVDTAGRLAIDQEMMTEISALHTVANPTETLFVVDAMMGQDAARTAKAFKKALPLTGIVLTKVDGDARGGAALSVSYVTGKPLKFLGTSEEIDGLELFHPDRIANRILGMGDVLSFIEDAERKVDKDKATKLAKKIVGGSRFNLQDYREQLDQLSDMGGMSAIQKMLPTNMPAGVRMKQVDETELKRQSVIIDSMTLREREFPALMDSSRKERIASGSGTSVKDVNQMLRKFKQAQKQLRKVGKGGGAQLRRAMAQLDGLNPSVKP